MDNSTEILKEIKTSRLLQIYWEIGASVDALPAGIGRQVLQIFEKYLEKELHRRFLEKLS